MKQGVIGQIDGSLGRINSFSKSEEQDGTELIDMVEVAGVQGTPGGLNITHGRAITQEFADERSISVASDEISISTEPTVSTTLTEFMTDGEEFVVVASSDGVFLYDLLEEVANVSVNRADIDLDPLWISLSNATPWKVGFYGHDGPVENGVVHGESVLDDGIFGSAIRDLKKNQLGIRVDLEGQEYKFIITKSGYLEVYTPRDTDTAEFAEFITNKILPHVNE